VLLGILAAAADAPTATAMPTPSPSPPPRELPAVSGIPFSDFAPATGGRLRPSDLWSIVEDTPGVILDRVNVGGSESALQPAVVWRGDAVSGTSWTLDGLDVTDPASPGASALYLHPALVEVTLASPGSLGVRTGGLPVVLRSAVAGGSLLFTRLAPAALQSDNLSPELRNSSLQANQTRWVAETGARLERRASHAVYADVGATWSQLRQRAFTEHDETHRLTSILGHASWVGTSSYVSMTAVRSEKVHVDRDTTLAAEPEARWRQSGPVHVIALRADHELGRHTRLKASAGFLDSTFRLDPPGGTSADPFEDFRGIFHGSYLSLHSKRRRLQLRTDISHSTSTGRGHVGAGVGYRRMPVSTQSGWPGNKVLAHEREQVFFRTFRLTGFAIPTRDQDVRSVHDHWEAYASGTRLLGDFAATVGVRVDRLSGHGEPVSIAANPLVPELLPAMTFEGSPARFRWTDVLPRTAVVWRPHPHLGTKVEACYNAYGGPLGSADVTFDHPGRDVASISYYWRDRNEDRVVQAAEIETSRGRLGSSGIDPDQPGETVVLHQIDPELRAPRTHEWSLMAQTVYGDTEMRITSYYRRNGLPLWRPVRGLRRSDYSIRGAVRGTLFEDDYSVGYYAPASASKIPPGNGRVLTNRRGYHQDVVGAELRLRGQLRAVRWETWAAGTDWRERFDDEETAIVDPTSTDGEPNRNAGAVAVRVGGFGRDIFVNARWSGGLAVNAPLPAGLTGYAFAHAREGFPVPYIHVANAGDPTAGAKSVLISPSLDAYRLPVLFELDLRLERAWKVRSGRLVAGADVFNALNCATPLQVNRDVESPSFAAPREVLRPRMVRLGLTFEF
jgi:hypothetical protein